MKAKFFVFAVFALLFGLAACKKEEIENNDPDQNQEVESIAISFTATADSGWEGVTSVAVMIDGTVKEYSVSNVNNTSATLSSDDPHYWPESGDVTVTAWSPYTAGETSVPDVVVQADQSTADGFATSYCISAEAQTVQSGDPTLVFTNRTAHVTINLTVFSDEPTSVKLTNLSGDPTEIVMYEYDKTSYTYVALVAPQTVAQGTAFITCTFDGEDDFTYEMQEAAEWVAGEEYTYEVSLADAGSGYTYNEGTNTYTVYSAKGLLAWNTAAQNDPTLSCTLIADIDLTNQEWTPVGTNSNRYNGLFNGGGYTIKGLTINGGDTLEDVGLFAYLGDEGEVRNLTLEDVSLTGYRYVGGVVGENYGYVVNCSVSGSITASSNVGGVVGYSPGTIINCSASGSVTATSSGSAGGIVGYVNGSVGVGTVTACNASCDVSGTGSSSQYIGGVAGRFVSGGYATACTASGDVSGYRYVGGVVGYGGTATACYSTGNVTGTYRYVGGVAGYGTVIACYHASGALSGESYVGGVAGQNTSTATACYWSDYDGNGIGTSSTSSGTTKVDGTDVTWSDAVEGMNAALTESDWEYELLEGNTLPTLKEK